MVKIKILFNPFNFHWCPKPIKSPESPPSEDPGTLFPEMQVLWCLVLMLLPSETFRISLPPSVLITLEPCAVSLAWMVAQLICPSLSCFFTWTLGYPYPASYRALSAMPACHSPGELRQCLQWRTRGRDQIPVSLLRAPLPPDALLT